MGHIHAISIREKSLRSELLLPFARARTMRLYGAAARLATLLRRFGAWSPRRAAAGLLRHAGSAAILAATLRARRRPLLAHGAALLAHSATTLFRGGPAAATLLLGRTRTPALLSATTALLRAWTSALLGLRRRPATLLGATTALLRAWSTALLDLRRQTGALLSGAAALLRRARGSPLLGAASMLWRSTALLRPPLRSRGCLLAARLATPLSLTSLFRPTWRLTLLCGARRTGLMRLLRGAWRTRPWWLLRRARCAGRLRSLRC